MIIKYSPAFLVTLKKANVRVRKRVKERMLLFSKNPNDLQLNNHALKRQYQGHRSIDITGDWRAIYREVQTGEEQPYAYFTALGTHAQLYRK